VTATVPGLGTFVSQRGTMHGGDLELRDMLIDVILAHEKARPRSMQTKLGPSEIGEPCARKLAYKLSGFPEPESYVDDPWYAIMGTAVHTHIGSVLDWENSMAEAQGAGPVWLVEERVTVRVGPDGVELDGSMDAYNYGLRRPVDHKLVGKTNHTKYRRHGPPMDYKIQIHAYGVGATNRGLPVEKVSIAFYPRFEYLSKALYVWTEPFNPALVDKALARLDIIAEMVRLLNPLADPMQFTKIQKLPSDNCRLCPWLRPSEEDTGMTCPGNMKL
jgi:hypothetical protein